LAYSSHGYTLLPQISFGEAWGHVEVQIGGTRWVNGSHPIAQPPTQIATHSFTRLDSRTDRQADRQTGGRPHCRVPGTMRSRTSCDSCPPTHRARGLTIKLAQHSQRPCMAYLDATGCWRRHPARWRRRTLTVPRKAMSGTTWSCRQWRRPALKRAAHHPCRRFSRVPSSRACAIAVPLTPRAYASPPARR